MDDPTDRIFVCQNEYCGEHSCRYCSVKSHHPKTCEGIPNIGLKMTVEYRKEEKTVNAKHTVEEAMTAALVNICNSCGRRFLKDAGCNKVTCTCGNTQCHVCGQNSNYDHFGPTKCPLYDDAATREQREVAAAQLQTVRTLLRQRTEMTAEELTVDRTLIGNLNDLNVVGDEDDLYGQPPPPEELARLKEQRKYEEDIERERERVAQIAREMNEWQEREEFERQEQERRAQEEAEERVRVEQERLERKRQEQLERERRETEEQEARRRKMLEIGRRQREWEAEQERETLETISAIEAVKKFERTERQKLKRETRAKEREIQVTTERSVKEKHNVIEAEVETIPTIISPVKKRRQRKSKAKEVMRKGKQPAQRGISMGLYATFMKKVRDILRLKNGSGR